MAADRTVLFGRTRSVATGRERPVRVASSSPALGEDRRLAPEPPDRAVDAKEEFPCGFGNRREALQAAARVAAPEHDDRSRQEDQRSADEPEPGPRPWDELRSVHHVPEDQSVPPADDPTRPEDERPVLDSRKRVGDRRLARPRRLLLQRGDREHGEDADKDESALHQPRCHVADRQVFELSPHDRYDYDRSSDVIYYKEKIEQRA